MELFIIMATIAVVCRDPAGTLRAAAAHKKAQIERDRAKGSKRRPGHRAMRNYLGTVWESRWAEATRRYPEQMRAAQERRAARQARRSQAWERMQDQAGQRWERRHFTPEEEPPPPLEEPAEDKDAPGTKAEDAPGTPGTKAEDTADPKDKDTPDTAATADGDQVIDLDAERRRRDQTEEPASGTDPEATQKGTTPMALNLSDATSLKAHLAALREQAAYQERTCTAKEQLAAGMRASDIGEATIGSVDASRNASSHAAAMARAAADALQDANMGVAEARAGNSEAGHGSYYERR